MPTYPAVPAVFALIVLAALSGCQKAHAPDGLNDESANEASGNRADATTGGPLGKRIVVDPAKTGGKSPAPATGATLRNGGSASLPGSGCEFRYAAAWAGKLPAELPVYPGASVAEAAGSDEAGCRRRIVSFTTGAPAETVIEFYRARVTRAGYSYERLVEQGSEVLGGTKGEAAYYVTVTPAGKGSAVDLVANAGG